MKHAIYEDPKTHKFALVTVPRTFTEGDKLPVPPDIRWFDSRAEAVAALSCLLDEDG